MFLLLIQRAMFLCLLALVLVCLVVSDSFAQTATAPVADGLLGGLVSLWGPFLGLIAAIVIFFNTLARIIPNSTTSGILKVLLMISSVLGVKVPDNK